ncbi:MAG: hypothetical protein ABH838_03170, partial [Actinomycetota bacterium]
ETKPKEEKEVKPVEPLTAEIKVDKSAAKANDPLKYTLLIKNNTDKAMDGLKIKFVNPTGLDTSMNQEGGSQPSFDQATNTWTWEVGTVNSKGSYWITIEMQMIPGAPSGASISAQFTVEGGSLASPVSSNTAITTIS